MFLGTLHVCSRFLISNFCCVVNVVFFLLGDSEFYMPTFRNTLFHIHSSCEQEVPVILLGQRTYKDGTERSETLAHKTHTPGNYPNVRIQQFPGYLHIQKRAIAN